MVVTIPKMRILTKSVYNNPNKIVIKSAGNYYGTHPNNDTSKPKFKWSTASNSYVPFAGTDVIPEPEL